MKRLGLGKGSGGAAKFDYSLQCKSLVPWPGGKPLVILWSRGSRKGATSASSPESIPGTQSQKYRWNDTISLPATLYKAGGAMQSAGGSGAYLKKCITLCLHEAVGGKPKGMPIGRVVIDLSEFAGFFTKEERFFKVATSPAIEAAVGDSYLEVAIESRWRKDGKKGGGGDDASSVASSAYSSFSSGSQGMPVSQGFRTLPRILSGRLGGASLSRVDESARGRDSRRSSQDSGSSLGGSPSSSAGRREVIEQADDDDGLVDEQLLLTSSEEEEEEGGGAHHGRGAPHAAASLRERDKEREPVGRARAGREEESRPAAAATRAETRSYGDGRSSTAQVREDANSAALRETARPSFAQQRSARTSTGLDAKPVIPAANDVGGARATSRRDGEDVVRGRDRVSSRDAQVLQEEDEPPAAPTGRGTSQGNDGVEGDAAPTRLSWREQRKLALEAAQAPARKPAAAKGVSGLPSAFAEGLSVETLLAEMRDGAAVELAAMASRHFSSLAASSSSVGGGDGGKAAPGHVAGEYAPPYASAREKGERNGLAALEGADVHAPARLLLFHLGCLQQRQQAMERELGSAPDLATPFLERAALMVAQAARCAADAGDVPRLLSWWSNAAVFRGTLQEMADAARHAAADVGKPPRPDSAKLGKESPLAMAVDALLRLESTLCDWAVDVVWHLAVLPVIVGADKRVAKPAAAWQGQGQGQGQGNRQDVGDGSDAVEAWLGGLNTMQVLLGIPAPVETNPAKKGARTFDADDGKKVLADLPMMVLMRVLERMDVAIFNAAFNEPTGEEWLDEGGGIDGKPARSSLYGGPVAANVASLLLANSRALPLAIRRGPLTFGRGVQLKMAVGRWASHGCVLSLLQYLRVGPTGGAKVGVNKTPLAQMTLAQAGFPRLRGAADILMMPKEALMDLSIRKEVCAALTLAQLCNLLRHFQPDEYSTESVPSSIITTMEAAAAASARGGENGQEPDAGAHGRDSRYSGHDDRLRMGDRAGTTLTGRATGRTTLADRGLQKTSSVPAWSAGVSLVQILREQERAVEMSIAYIPPMVARGVQYVGTLQLALAVLAAAVDPLKAGIANGEEHIRFKVLRETWEIAPRK